MATMARVPWYGVTGTRLTILGIVGMFVLGVVGVVWGTLFPEQVAVRQFDAGPETDFAIGKVVVFPEPNIYLVGLENGQIRAVDGVVRTNQCVVEHLPDDARGVPKNPKGAAGVLVDPCSGGVWAMTGDAISGADRPLRTFAVMGVDVGGTRHVQVEVLGERHPQPQGAR